MEDTQEIVEVKRDLIFMKPIFVEVVDSLQNPKRDRVVPEPKGVSNIILISNVPRERITSIIH